MNKAQLEKALSLLVPMLTQSRKNKISSVVASRTRSLAVLLENVHDKGNENAVIRTMDAFGVLSMHRVTTVLPTRKSDPTVRTDAGTRQWIEMQDWSDLGDCIRTLKGNGYQIASTSPDSMLGISDVDFCRKTVIAFGNERHGISDTLSSLSDFKFSLPMCGFVESFNISVSVAVTLYHAYTQRVGKLGTSGDLLKEDQDRLTVQYYMKSIGISEQQLLHLLSTQV